MLRFPTSVEARRKSAFFKKVTLNLTSPHHAVSSPADEESQQAAQVQPQPLTSVGPSPSPSPSPPAPEPQDLTSWFHSTIWSGSEPDKEVEVAAMVRESTQAQASPASPFLHKSRSCPNLSGRGMAAGFKYAGVAAGATRFPPESDPDPAKHSPLRDNDGKPMTLTLPKSRV